MFWYNMMSLVMVLLVLHLYFVHNYFMSALLVLEATVILALIFSMVTITQIHSSSGGFLLVLTFGVGEAALGLSLLLTLIKSKGNDLISISSSQKY
uniref:NADH dehydrogenase subunit 4L n=2 Tax=Reinia TaxID=1290136 RepID=A0A347Z6A0_9EUPU|nr:NADH dehydrogenase subunit 4L [Reinia ashizuriensis]BBA10091.1 NADH dehydrogenase subunit 4L [Reinia variegata]BBA10220.1 NADH dehydrogenase subunit 4L [Reinia variegata]BBA10223.1 NADH dehydrogenase subunit 4L [Reinia variegata]BBA10694.1 NADH dehydrogenase subunit 4L [Reinia ashizuriensis]